MPYKHKSDVLRNKQEYRARNLESIKEWQKEYRKKNKVSLAEWKKEYYQKNKIEIKRKFLDWKKRNPEKFKSYDLKVRYGISYEDYKKMETKQKGRCAICKNKETATRRDGRIIKLAVDHCHSKGSIRGLLCGACNKGLGYFRDDKLILGSAIKYLEKLE